MINYSIIPKSQLEGAKRLDAEYYQPEYLSFMSQINKFRVKKGGEIGKILRGNTPKEYGDYDIPIIRSGDLSNFFINENLLRAKNKNIFYVKNGDILISSIGLGSIGKVNIFTHGNEKTGTVSEVTVIRETKISPFYIWAFLTSKYGQFQINREITGATGQLHLNIGNVNNIFIPLLKEMESFDNLYKNAEKFFNDSQTFYYQAENLLLKNLGLINFHRIEELTYIINSSELTTASRLDAQHFQPLTNTLIKLIYEKGATKIKDIAIFNKRGVQPEYYDDGEINVVTSKHLGRTSLDYENLDETSFDLWKENPGAQIKQNDILIYTTGANIGRTNCYLESNDAIAGNHVNILRVKGFNQSYLSVFLNSFLGQQQVKKFMTGSAQTELYPDDISRFVVWNAPKETQQKIADLVRKSHEARKKSKELLEEAKRKVEEMIDRGGEN